MPISILCCTNVIPNRVLILLNGCSYLKTYLKMFETIQYHVLLGKIQVCSIWRQAAILTSGYIFSCPGGRPKTLCPGCAPAVELEWRWP